MKKVFWFIFLTVSVLFGSENSYVILVSFDGFRWDYVNRGITPNIRKVIDNGVHAISLRPSFPSKTFPNHYTIITGMYPEHHGIIANRFYDQVENEWFSLSNKNNSKFYSKWYKGEAFWETARKNGILCASYFWPASDIDDESRRPEYFKIYDEDTPYKDRIDSLISWLGLPAKKRPHFLSVYFHDTDTYGHDYGPNSEEINQSISRMDSLTGYLLDELSTIGMIDSVNIILTSDHGMTETSNEEIINIEEIVEPYECLLEDLGPVVRITPNEDEILFVYRKLLENKNHYSVYLKKNIPGYFHFSDNPMIAPIIVIADPGWSFVKNEKLDENYSGGNHGYDNNQLDMHGIFIAEGPDFKSGYITGTLWNIDIYPLLCKIFNVEPAANIDGKLERIEFVLKEQPEVNKNK